ncbi:MAG: phage holin family protein, partial [Proteobacteria bacterium]|nr:phage holin family protein [Pseudomonadota bacterium]
VIAAVLFALAGRPPAGRDLELASEIHGSAVDTLQIEASAAQAQLSRIIDHPINNALPLLLVPLITIIVRSLKKSRAAAPTAATTERS